VSGSRDQRFDTGAPVSDAVAAAIDDVIRALRAA
jgi:hypothetical protein